MADFRRLLYAFALVALLVGLSVPASAISLMSCTGTSQALWARGEDYTALTGDLIITCTGGEYTANGVQIPKVDITVTVANTNFTSKITATAGDVKFTESILVMDEAGNPNLAGTNPMVACGSGTAPYATSPPAAPYTCNITGLGAPGNVYTGASGRPNVFQGRQLNVSNGISLVFPGIPLEAGPTNGLTPTRYMRISNLRVNAAALGISGPSAITQDITMTVNFGGALAGQQDIIIKPASVRGGLKVSQGTNSATAKFLQCEPLAGTIGKTIKIEETYFTFFKARNVSVLLGNGTGSGSSYTNPNKNWTATDFAQYPNRATESGLVGDDDGELGFDFENSTGNIIAAGKAQQGTRLAVKFSNIPAGSKPSIPNSVPLKSGGNTTGVMVLVTGTDSAGAGGTVSSGSGTTLISDLTGNMAVYEVLYANPDAIETAEILLTVDPVKDLTASPSTPEVGVTASAKAGFAPFYEASTGAGIATPMSAKFVSGTPNTFPVPRFISGADQGPIDLYSFNKCSCNLLFPWVVGDSTFTTSIVIANTSKDPGSSNGFSANPQSGIVKFWYYGTTGISLDPTTPISTQAAQSSTAVVPAGSYLAHIVSPSSAGNTPANGLVKLAANFAGYVISQAQFQYCHGVASISANVPGFGTQTYLGLTLDDGINGRLPRTSQSANDGLVH